MVYESCTNVLRTKSPACKNPRVPVNNRLIRVPSTTARTLSNCPEYCYYRVVAIWRISFAKPSRSTPSSDGDGARRRIDGRNPRVSTRSANKTARMCFATFRRAIIVVLGARYWTTTTTTTKRRGNGKFVFAFLRPSSGLTGRFSFGRWPKTPVRPCFPVRLRELRAGAARVENVRRTDMGANQVSTKSTPHARL